jgi:hypothetical protein
MPIDLIVVVEAVEVKSGLKSFVNWCDIGRNSKIRDDKQSQPSKQRPSPWRKHSPAVAAYGQQSAQDELVAKSFSSVVSWHDGSYKT